ncbi:MULTISPECIES: tyrosine-type recombinase/integrase [unclassified Clostridioides]|uniref:tyrosine-type recombinase/integrase n=1 Tax=unclassified Clostridioides TaxID=2635829 RepID=UPI001D114408|nr:tyrosine-type recombinase/integrase [Clostridioides sp. ES-S-0054-01]
MLKYLRQFKLFDWKNFAKHKKLVAIDIAPFINIIIKQSLVLLNTGLRISELCGLTLADIDFNTSTLLI